MNTTRDPEWGADIDAISEAMARPKMSDHFADLHHALYCGWVLGTLLNTVTAVEPISEGPGYTNRFKMNTRAGWIELSIPYPPEDWEMA